MSGKTFFISAIRETRDIFGPPPRKIDPFKMARFKCKPPAWIRDGQETELSLFYKNQYLLARKGDVVWGHTIQANELLFRDGDMDHPAALMYSLDPEMDNSPYILEDAAHDLFAVKGEDTAPDLQEFADKLADEMITDWKIPVPPRLTQGIQCYYLTTMIIRKHLPDSYLAGGLFPFLVCPEETDVGMILPKEYWSPAFKREMWQ